VTPDEFRAWVRVLRDFAIVGIGAFILVHEEVAVRTPNPYLIAAGLIALGLPPALRVDEWLGGRKNGNGKNGVEK